MAAASSQFQLSGLGRALVQKGLLAERDAHVVQAKANEGSISFVEQLIASKKFNETEVAEFAAHTFGFPLLDLQVFDMEYLPQKHIDANSLISRRAVPLFTRGNRLFVGISDPTNRSATDQIKFQTGLHIEPVVVEDTKLGTLINKLVTASGAALKELADDEMAGDLMAAEPDTQPGT